MDIGSNYDATGASIDGQHICVFAMDWAETQSSPARGDVPVTLREIGPSD